MPKHLRNGAKPKANDPSSDFQGVALEGGGLGGTGSAKGLGLQAVIVEPEILEPLQETPKIIKPENVPGLKKKKKGKK